MLPIAAPAPRSRSFVHRYANDPLPASLLCLLQPPALQPPVCTGHRAAATLYSSLRRPRYCSTWHTLSLLRTCSAVCLTLCVAWLRGQRVAPAAVPAAATSASSHLSSGVCSASLSCSAFVPQQVCTSRSVAAATHAHPCVGTSQLFFLCAQRLNAVGVESRCSTSLAGAMSEHTVMISASLHTSLASASWTSSPPATMTHTHTHTDTSPRMMCANPVRARARERVCPCVRVCVCPCLCVCVCPCVCVCVCVCVTCHTH